jgi:WD40 repeat protein
MPVSHFPPWPLRLAGAALVLAALPAAAASVEVLALGSDGRRVAVSGVSSERGDRPWLRVLDIGKPGELEFTGKLHADSALGFSRDGQLLFSGNRAGKVRLWDARSGRPMSKPLAAHDAEVVAVVPLDDGSGFVSTASASFTRSWPTQPQSWHKLMCEKLDSNPSRKQWREWVSTQVDYRCVCPSLAIAADGPSAPTPQRCPG